MQNMYDEETTRKGKVSLYENSFLICSSSCTLAFTFGVFFWYFVRRSTHFTSYIDFPFPCALLLQKRVFSLWDFYYYYKIWYYTDITSDGGSRRSIFISLLSLFVIIIPFLLVLIYFTTSFLSFPLDRRYYCIFLWRNIILIHFSPF